MPRFMIKGRYELKEVIGRGGMGLVYSAYDTFVGRDVAVKTIGAMPERASLDRFYREWWVLGNMRHANIVEILDIGEFEEDGLIKLFFVMPLLRGLTLEQLIHTPGQPMTVDRLAEIISQACCGLHAAHEKGVIHRNLKPANIFVLEDNSVRLLDFGVAHLMGSRSASYMAPEQIQNQECTPACDIFSLGVVCHEALETNPGISQAVRQAIRKAMAKHPQDRFSSAPELALTLQKAVREDIEKSYTEACQYLENGEYDRVLELCRAWLARYPGHELFEALRCESEERHNRQVSLNAAEVVRQAAAEPDLERRLRILEKAAESFPGEARFDQWLRSVRGKLALINSIVTKARTHEEQGRFPEALERWQTLRSIYSHYPGVEYEIERLTSLAGKEPAGVSAPTISPLAAGWTRFLAAASRFTSAHAQMHRQGTPVQWIPVTTAVAVLITSAALITAKLRTSPPSRDIVAPIEVLLHTSPSGALIRVNSEFKGAANPILKLQLSPGSYQLEAVADGYRPAVHTFTVAPGPPLSLEIPPLEMLPQLVALSSDMEKGKVWLDDKPVGDFAGAQFALDSVAPGKHMMKVSDQRSQFTMNFEIVPGRAPTIIGPVSARELAAVAVSHLGRSLRVYSSLSPFRISVDGKQAADVGPDGLELNDLASGPHELTVGEGKTQRKLYVESGPAPGLNAFLYSDRNVGALVVAANQDAFQVFLNDQEYRRPIHEGLMRISNLDVRDYRVRIRKNGYYDEPEQTVSIRKGEEAKLAVALRAVPKVSYLQVRGVPAGTQIFLDNAPLGPASSAGSFGPASVSPGEHSLEFRNAPRYKPKTLKKSFRDGETLQLSGNEVNLDRNPATVTISAIPTGVRLFYTCGDDEQSRQINEPVTVTCPEGAFAVMASKPGYEEVSKSLQLVAGEKHELGLTLPKREVVAAPVKRLCGIAELRNSGAWSQEGTWWVHKKGSSASVPCPQVAGQYEFTVAPPKGHFPIGKSKVQWTFDQGAQSGPLVFQFDRKTFVPPKGSKQDISEYEQDGKFSFRIEVSANRIVHSIRTAAGWTKINTVEDPAGKLLQGKLAFQNQVRLASFMFREN